MTVPSADRRSLPRVSIVIPALNEALNLPYVFARIPEDIHEIILVDGYSEDDTVVVARRLSPDVRVINQTRKGKGNALACGFAAATGDIIAMIDADGSADPRRSRRSWTRFSTGPISPRARATPRRRQQRHHPPATLGQRLLTSLFNFATGSGTQISATATTSSGDSTRPCWASTRRPYLAGDGNEQRWGDGFEVETLIHVRVAKAGLAVAEVPSFEHARIHGVSNLNVFSDGIRVLRTILTERRHAGRPSPQPAAQPSAPAPAVAGRYALAEVLPENAAPRVLPAAKKA